MRITCCYMVALLTIAHVASTANGDMTHHVIRRQTPQLVPLICSITDMITEWAQRITNVLPKNIGSCVESQVATVLDALCKGGKWAVVPECMNLFPPSGGGGEMKRRHAQNRARAHHVAKKAHPRHAHA